MPLRLPNSLLPDSDSVQTYTDDTSTVKFGGGYQQDAANSPQFQRETWDLTYSLLNEVEYNKLFNVLMAASTVQYLLWQPPGQTSNYLRYSNTLNNAVWEALGGITRTQISAGSLHDTAWSVEAPAGGNNTLSQGVTYPTHTDWTLSGYFLSVDDTPVTLTLQIGTGFARVMFNAKTGETIGYESEGVINFRYGKSQDAEGYWRIYVTAEGVEFSNQLSAAIQLDPSTGSVVKMADIQLNPGDEPARISKTLARPSFKAYKRSKEGKLTQTRRGQTYTLKFQLVEVASGLLATNPIDVPTIPLPLPFVFDPGLMVALNTRKTNPGYNGPYMTVRRSIDQAEQDIPFNATPDAFGNYYVDEAALSLFVGAGDGFMTRKYNQNGGPDEVVNTAAAQLRVVTDGQIYKFKNDLMGYAGNVLVDIETEI